MAKSVIRASSANRWAPATGCQGSGKLIAELPDRPRDTTAAEMGTKAHKIAEVNLATGVPVEVLVTAQDFEDVEEAISAILVYTEHCVGLTDTDEEPTMRAEKEVSLSHLHPQLNKGVIDYDYFLLGTQHVIDFKFGKTAVSAFENWQLICYASESEGQAYFDSTTFHLTIIQPRAWKPEGSIDTWVVTGAELRPYIEQIRASAIIATSENPPLRSGSHCKNCPARHVCPAARQASTSMLEYLEQPLPDDMSNEALALEYSLLLRGQDAIKDRVKALEAEMIYLIRDGQRVKGYSMQTTYGKRKFKADKQAELKIKAKALGVEVENTSLITPAEAERRGFDPEYIKDITERPEYLKLKESTDLLKLLKTSEK